MDVIGRGEQIPFSSNHFDLVLRTQVVQYVPDASLVVEEIVRVIKPVGFFFLSVPSVYPMDSGEEYGRFLPARLRQLFGEFQQVDIAPKGSSIGGFFRACNVCFNLLAHFSTLKWLLKYSVFPAMNVAGALPGECFGKT